MRTYTGVYKPSKGDPITVKSLSRPPDTRVFRATTGRRKYKLVKLTSTNREVIIMAKTASKSRKKAVEPEEIEEIQALEELNEDEDEEVPEVEDDETDEDEDEAPKSKKASKGKTKKAEPATSRAKANGRVGTAEIAERAGVDSRTLRMVLRKHAVEKDDESGRYEWDSMKDPTVKKILKWLEKGEADDIKKEALDKLKARKAEKDAAKSKGKKKGKKSKKSDDDE